MRKLAIITFMAATFAASTASAYTPSIRGIDLPTILAFYDQARKLDFQTNPVEAKQLKTIKTIVLDPGHGGENEGAVGVAGILEKYLTLELAYALRAKIQKQYPDARVLLTRYWDESLGLSDRAHFANVYDADLFISLHYNAASHSRAIGFETYFLRSNWVSPGKAQKKSKPIAAIRHTEQQPEDAKNVGKSPSVNNAVVAKIFSDLKRQRRHRDAGLLARSVQGRLTEALSEDSVDRGVKQENFTVLRGTTMPAIVVESGFLTHPSEGQMVIEAEHRTKIVDALMQAIADFDETVASRTK